MVDLINLLSRIDISKKDIILIILFYNNNLPKSVAEIKKIGSEHGKHEIKKWNISDLLLKSKPLVVRLDEGWCLTDKGKEKIANDGYINYSPLKQHEKILRSYLENVKSDEVKKFLDESITCLEYKLLRSAVVLSWVGAISILQDRILHNHLKDFNIEYNKRFPKKKIIKVKDDFSLIKEYDFLQIISSISVISKNLKQQLEQCLNLRNSCGHPNSLEIGEHMVQNHLEILIKNIYDKYI